MVKQRSSKSLLWVQLPLSLSILHFLNLEAEIDLNESEQAHGVMRLYPQKRASRASRDTFLKTREWVLKTLIFKIKNKARLTNVYSQNNAKLTHNFPNEITRFTRQDRHELVIMAPNSQITERGDSRFTVKIQPQCRQSRVRWKKKQYRNRANYNFFSDAEDFVSKSVRPSFLTRISHVYVRTNRAALLRARGFRDPKLALHNISAKLAWTTTDDGWEDDYAENSVITPTPTRLVLARQIWDLRTRDERAIAAVANHGRVKGQLNAFLRFSTCFQSNRIVVKFIFLILFAKTYVQNSRMFLQIRAQFNPAPLPYSYLRDFKTPDNLFLFKKLAKTLKKRKMTATITPWYVLFLTRFVEHCSGKKTLIHLFMFILQILTLQEQILCALWARKMQHFQKAIGTGFFLNEAVQILFVALKLKDPYFLINWTAKTFKKINFWRYKFFFFFFRHVLGNFFQPMFRNLNIRGFKLKLKGKISVTGNARTRSLSYNVGSVTSAHLKHKTLYAIDIVRTFTGVQGLQIWIAF